MTSMFALWAGALLSLGGPVTEVAITPMGEQTSVLIAIEGDVEYRDFLMEGPHRLIVDLMGAQNALPRNEFSEVNRGGIRIVTARQYSEDVVRVWSRGSRAACASRWRTRRSRGSSLGRRAPR